MVTRVDNEVDVRFIHEQAVLIIDRAVQILGLSVLCEKGCSPAANEENKTKIVGALEDVVYFSQRALSEISGR